jgi:tetratricopeptide (TPR) repeat protein
VKIAIYALAKNESANVARWEESCRDADVRVVTDTGSTDDTVALLEAAGVLVARGAPIPWRWDDAHNLSLMHVPADVDVAIRLDLDEELDPGWREALERAWVDGTTRLHYPYHWSADVRFYGDRVHARHGHRWQGATHEGLVCWDGEEKVVRIDDLVIRHHREPGKVHKSDLTLLRQACRENPADARMHWYLARELDTDGNEEAAAAYERYLQMAGGSPHERAHACRRLSRLRPERADLHALAAVWNSPHEPEVYASLAGKAWGMKDAVGALYWARRALACSDQNRTHSSEPWAYGVVPADIAYSAAYELGLHDEAITHAREAAKRDPADHRHADNVAALVRMKTEDGPKP